MKKSLNLIAAAIAVLMLVLPANFVAADAVGTSVSIANSPPEIRFESAVARGGGLEAVFSISDNNGAGDVVEKSAQCSAYDPKGVLLEFERMGRGECGGISCEYSCRLKLVQAPGTITVRAVASDSGGAEARAEAKIELAETEGAGQPASSGEPAPVTGLAVTQGNGIYDFLSGFFSWLGSFWK
ncbi:hypothetical protein HY995_02625 [Candidatus Micrarchaeota archaeon]|nr:hypothetical protein [Candidatus Micrarchaeota archaeon]MBI5176959.1 hypothetical protein [Candidatus Micrarchaeota archaeon]